MRILSAGDLHGDRSLAEKLAKKAEDEHVDLVLLCGDLTMADEEPTGLIGAFLKRGQKVLFVPGNHDSNATADFLSTVYPIKNLHGYSAQYKEIGIFGCGKANIGPERLTEQEFHATLTEAHRKIELFAKRIMVTHVHPSGTVAEKMTRYFKGSAGVRKAIEELQPDIAFCCHVHEAEGLEEQIGKTRVINVGRKGFLLDL